MLLPGTGPEGAAMLARRLRERLEGLRLHGPGGDLLAATASFGIAACPLADGADDVLAAADTALYQAKRDGKNRVVEAVQR